jgi:hypothetical protein
MESLSKESNSNRLEERQVAFGLLGKIQLASLILAQNERWRRA